MEELFTQFQRWPAKRLEVFAPHLQGGAHLVGRHIGQSFFDFLQLLPPTHRALRAAERPTSPAGAAAETLNLETPGCGPGQVRRLVRRFFPLPFSSRVRFADSTCCQNSS